MTLSHKHAELKRVLRRAESGQAQLKAATQVCVGGVCVSGGCAGGRSLCGARTLLPRSLPPHAAKALPPPCPPLPSPYHKGYPRLWEVLPGTELAQRRRTCCRLSHHASPPRLPSCIYTPSFRIPPSHPAYMAVPFCLSQAALEKLSRADKKLAQQVLPHIADMPSKLQKYR